MQIQNNLRSLPVWFSRSAIITGRIVLCALVSQLGAQELISPVSTASAVSVVKRSWLPMNATPALKALFESQDPAAPGTPARANNSSHDLTISVSEGEGAINSLGQGTSRPIIIRVLDARGLPVEGAVVTFLLPTDGPSGTFPNGTRNLSVTTDNLGRAIATGFTPNSVTGVLEIKVNVTLHGETAHAIVHQTNSNGAEAVPATTGGTSSAAAPKKSSNTMLLVLAGVGAAAAVGAALAFKGGSSSSSGNTGNPPPISTVGITIGTGSIGPGH